MSSGESFSSFQDAVCFIQLFSWITLDLPLTVQIRFSLIYLPSAASQECKPPVGLPTDLLSSWSCLIYYGELQMVIKINGLEKWADPWMFIEYNSLLAHSHISRYAKMQCVMQSTEMHFQAGSAILHYIKLQVLRHTDIYITILHF